MAQEHQDEKTKYRWILIEEDGNVSGTNDEEVAMDFSHGEVNVVIDTKNQDQVVEGSIVTIEETRYKVVEEDDSEDEEDFHRGKDGEGQY